MTERRGGGGTSQAGHSATARRNANALREPPHTARPASSGTRALAVAAALLAVLPMLTFACAIVVNGFGRRAVAIVLDIGLATTAIAALVLAAASLTFALVGLQPRSRSSHGKESA